jgi:hypothetical protein
MTEESNYNPEIKRLFNKNEESVKEMIEILCAKIRGYQLFKITETELIGKAKMLKPNSHPKYDEIMDLINWVAEFMPVEDYPFRINTIKNQLWESISL